MSNEELKPCPFCGGRAVLKEGEECAVAQCLNMSVHRLVCDGDNNCAEEITKIWNQRVSHPDDGDSPAVLKTVMNHLHDMKRQHEKALQNRVLLHPGDTVRKIEAILELAAAPTPDEDGESDE